MAAARSTTRSISARLQQAVDEGKLDTGKPVDVATLVAAGILRRPHDGVRVLGGGEFKAKLSLIVDHATARSQERHREARAARIELIVPKVLPDDEAKRKKTATKKAKADKPAKGAAAAD